MSGLFYWVEGRKISLVLGLALPCKTWKMSHNPHAKRLQAHKDLRHQNSANIKNCGVYKCQSIWSSLLTFLVGELSCWLSEIAWPITVAVPYYTIWMWSRPVHSILDMALVLPRIFTCGFLQNPRTVGIRGGNLCCVSICLLPAYRVAFWWQINIRLHVPK